MTGMSSLVGARAPIGLGDSDDASRPLNVVIGLEGLALGGCPINALDLGRALRERGHSVHVFAIEEQVQVSLLPYAEQSGFEVTLLPADAGVARRSAHIRRFADLHSADVIHVYAPWLASSAAASVPSRRARIAVVTNMMMANVTYMPRQMPLIVGTRIMQEEAQLSHQSRVYLIEPPVDINRELASEREAMNFREELGIAPDEIVAMIVSRVDSQMKAEGIEHTIRAIHQLHDTEMRLVIVGDGDAFQAISLLADEANDALGRRAVILAGVRHDPRPAYASADIMIGMGGSALRALAHGKPLIVLGEGGFSRLFGPADLDYFLTYGFYGEGSNGRPEAQIADTLRELLDGERREELGAFGREIVRSRFGLEASATTLENIYRTELDELRSVKRQTFEAAGTLCRALGHEGFRRIERGLWRLVENRPSANPKV